MDSAKDSTSALSHRFWQKLGISSHSTMTFLQDMQHSLSLTFQDTKLLSYSSIAIVLGLAFILWNAITIIYNVYFHPLSKFPGPFWARASLFWRFWHSMQGRFHRVVEDSHRQYGDVFRVSPNELSFGTASSFKAIYGSPGPDRPRVPKDSFYDMFGAGFSEACIGSERDPQRAGAKRALFMNAFSAKSLAEQEDVIQRNTNAFVEKLGLLGSGPGGIDMVKWYEMVSFDVLGEMAFGESFDCIKNESSHFWLDIILGHMLAITLMDNLRRFPLVLSIVRALPSKWTAALSNKQSEFSREKVRRRLEMDLEQKDFLSNVAAKVKNGEVPEEEMAAHSSTFVIAGGETTATSIAAMTFHLLKSPASHEKLKREIRGRFKSLNDITFASASQLPYLQAVIKEGLRIFPANSQGLPRRSPGISVDGTWVPEGTEFYTSPWTVAHDARNFHDPMIFKPERWIGTNKVDNKEASQPFSLGPRQCIGRSFAYAQMSLELAKVVFAYDMELVDPNLDYEAGCHMHFMWWKPKLWIRFSKPRGGVVDSMGG